eukprot:COSAG01_NODE_2412_length_7746_cov_8.081993_8_plen_189_part_00
MPSHRRCVFPRRRSEPTPRTTPSLSERSGEQGVHLGGFLGFLAPSTVSPRPPPPPPHSRGASARRTSDRLESQHSEPSQTETCAGSAACDGSIAAIMHACHTQPSPAGRAGSGRLGQNPDLGHRGDFGESSLGSAWGVLGSGCRSRGPSGACPQAPARPHRRCAPHACRGSGAWPGTSGGAVRVRGRL